MKVLTADTFAVPIAPRMADSTAMAIFSINCQLMPLPSFSGVFFLVMVVWFLGCSRETGNALREVGAAREGAECVSAAKRRFGSRAT